MDEDQLELAREYQRNLRAKRPTTPAQKRAWSARVAEYERTRKEKDPEAHRKRIRKRTQAANANGMNAVRQRRANLARREVLDEIKQRAGCADCGRKGLRPECYDFDHLPGAEKAFSIGVNMRRDWGSVMDEIQKCEVVCANCHRIRTVDRKGERLPAAPPVRGHIDHVGRDRDLCGEAAARGLLPPRNA